MLSFSVRCTTWNTKKHVCTVVASGHVPCIVFIKELSATCEFGEV